MPTIERHVARVRNRLTLQHLLHALAWAALGLVVVAWVAVIVFKLTRLAPPRPMHWLVALAVAGVVAAIGWALTRRPRPIDAAVAIDARLGLREKFSTALCIRQSDDPFARAAVRDAETTAEQVRLHGQFPLALPRVAPYALTCLAGLALTHWLLPQYDLLRRDEAEQVELAKVQQQRQADQQIAAIARTIEAAEAQLANAETLRDAKQALEGLRQLAARDPEAASRRAAAVQKDLDEQLREQIRNSEQFARAQADQRLFQNNVAAPTETGPVADAHRALSQGDFRGATSELQRAVQNFANASPQQRQQQAEQMQKLADQLQKMASDPQAQQRMQDQLQRMGMNDQQAKQAGELLKQAAQGDPQAQQQLQQMAQQAMQQMNNGQGPTPQQQQQMQQMLQQMQAQATSQQQAQQLADAAKQLSQAMQQMARQQAGTQQPGQQQQPAQSNPGTGAQANGQAPSQGQSPSDDGGDSQGDGDQAMAGAMEAMQQTLDEMEAIQQDLAQMQALCQGGGNGNGNGNNPGNKAGGQGRWGAGDPNGRGGGMGGPGQGQGGRAESAVAPFDTQAEKSPSQDQRGRVLARTFVRDGQILVGESQAQLRQTAQAEQERATEEVEQQRISRQAQRAVREYFKTLAGDPPPTPPAAGE
jgi:hypothetical protein